MVMKALPALTIKQPWAQLIMLGIKDIENRTWATEYRGPIFIHAGQKWDSDPWPVESGLTIDEDLVPRGMILGTVDLVDIVKDSVSPWALPFQYHWVIKNPSLLSAPVPWRGQMGLWYPTKFSA